MDKLNSTTGEHSGGSHCSASLWTVQDVASYLQCTSRTVANLQNEGMPTIKLLSMVRFDPDDVKRWVRNARRAVPRMNEMEWALREIINAVDMAQNLESDGQEPKAFEYAMEQIKRLAEDGLPNAQGQLRREENA
jgi:hypothetical protein